MEAARQPRKLFHAGKIVRRKEKRPCANGCVGPFVRRPDMDEWLIGLAEHAGLPSDSVLPQYDCRTCMTTRGYTAHDLKRAS